MQSHRIIASLLLAGIVPAVACAPAPPNTSPEVAVDVQGTAAAAAPDGVPAGYMVRLDRPTAELADVRYAASGNGWEVTTGPAHILYSPQQTVTGSYTVSATIEQLERPQHPEAFGLFIGGRDLDGPNQTYTYFLVRGTGEMFVQRRMGDALHRLIAWQPSEWIPGADAQGRASYALQIRVRPDSLLFRVNDVQVAALPNTADTAAEGIAGLRINHNLRVRATPVTITRP